MPDTTPVARSALTRPGAATLLRAGWELPRHHASGQVAIGDRSDLAKVLVKAPAAPDVEDAMGARFGRAAWHRDRLVTGSGPGEWLVLAPPGSVAETSEWCTAALAGATDGLTSVVDITHGRALLRLSGPATLALLHRVTAMDLDDRFVPDGAAFRTSVARVVTDLVRDDIDDRPSYLLHCERSSGRYLLESLLAAGADFGAQIDGGEPAWPDHAGAATVQ